MSLFEVGCDCDDMQGSTDGKSCLFPWLATLGLAVAVAYVGISPAVYKKVHAFESGVKAKYLTPRKRRR
jgi:hypothetical protein